jgi:hypothetical protein
MVWLCKQVLKEVGTNGIICSGVSVGSIDTVLPYLSEMRSITLGTSGYGKFPTCERNGVDQGVHNVLVHTDKIKNMKIWSQSNSPVLNLQAKMARVEGMVVKNNHGDLVAVVHQYDRYPDLQRELFKEVSKPLLSHFTLTSLSLLSHFSLTSLSSLSLHSLFSLTSLSLLSHYSLTSLSLSFYIALCTAGSGHFSFNLTLFTPT